MVTKMKLMEVVSKKTSQIQSVITDCFNEVSIINRSMKIIGTLIFSSLFALSGIYAQTKTVTLKKPGSLKSALGKDTQFTKLVVKGEFNDKDLNLVATLTNLTCLDLSGASYPKQLKSFPTLNVKELYLPEKGFMPHTLLNSVASCPNLEIFSTTYPYYAATRQTREVFYPQFRKKLKKVIISGPGEVDYNYIDWNTRVVQEVDSVEFKMPINIVGHEEFYGFKPKYIIKDGVAYLYRSNNIDEILSAEAVWLTENIELPTYYYGWRLPQFVELKNTKVIKNLFSCTHGVEKVTIKSDNLSWICPEAFRNCRYLKEIVIECKSDKPVKIDTEAFVGCGNLKKVVLNCNTIIEPKAFHTGGKIETVIFNGVATIRDYAFGNISNAIFNVIPDTITEHFSEIPNNQSGKNGNLCANIRVPKGKIDTFVGFGFPKSILFDPDAGLDLTVTMEEGGSILNKIPLDKLSQITSLKVIGVMYETDLDILSKCKNLKILDISQTFTTLSPEKWKKQNEHKAFLNGLFSLMGDIAEQEYKNGETTTIDYTNNKMMTELLKNATEVESSDPGCVIGQAAISGLYNLETLILPYRCKEIQAHNFANCPNLSEVRWPMYIERIGSGCFENTGLKEVILPASVTFVDDVGVFYYCRNLEKIDYSQCSIGKKDWYITFKGCSVLKEVHFSKDVNRIYLAPQIDGCSFYIPENVTYLKHNFHKENLHFSGRTAPSSTYGYPKQCKIFLPKGCMTNYYTEYDGLDNTFIEE